MKTSLRQHIASSDLCPTTYAQTALRADLVSFALLLVLPRTLLLTGLTFLWNRYGVPEFKARKRAKHRLPAGSSKGRHSTATRPGFYPQRVPQALILRFQGLTSTIQHHAAA